MARRKKEEPSGGAGWLATFGDLMNLLLCFFVLLFSMSSIDADKFEALVQSLQHSFSILPQGGAAVGEGQMVSSGVRQLQLLDDYFKEITNSETDEEEHGETGENDKQDNGTQEDLEESLKEEYSEAALKESEQMEEQIEEMLKQQQIADQVEISANADYVLITLNGALLFDSGQSDIREDALPLVDKLALILERYHDNLIDIEGHTDNVPIKNEKYENNDVLSAYRAFSVKNRVLESGILEAGKIHATGCGEYNPVADNSTPEGRARNRRVEIKIYNSYNSN